jgi:hypothetical protein
MFRKQELQYVLELFNGALLPSGLFYEAVNGIDVDNTTLYDFMTEEW